MALIIGIDPGVSTGFAAWDPLAKQFTRIESTLIHEAMFEIDRLHRDGLLGQVIYEDARLRAWFGNHSAAKDRAKLQGAGSIKRDCVIWNDFLTVRCITHCAVKPSKGATKWDAEKFARITGWKGRTNEHGRDAALLVFGRG